jgi:arylsulfatase A-like enzyme
MHRIVILFVTAIAACATLAHAADKPNVIIVLSDDQGYGDFSCHGNPALKTPNLDKLHDESIRLTDFHVAPMCTPTRGQLMTGLDALRTRASSVCAGRSFIPRETLTMADVFKKSGYETGLFGKWHLGDSYPNLPHQRGFDRAIYHLGWGITSMADLWCNDYFDGRFRDNGELKPYPGYCTDVWFDQAIGWMKKQHEEKKPFFVYLPTNAPHGPLWIADKYRQPYLDQKLPRPLSSFFGMIANIDENMGKLDEFLKQSGLRDNTIVIYFHDNGGTAGVNYYNAGMRGKKTTYYEGGHRAACFIRWPNGKLLEPCDIGELTHVQDILPTLGELCELLKPAAVDFDGMSLGRLLRGTMKSLGERTLVVQYGQNPEKWQSAVMWHRWRLVHGEELYELSSDPAQATNVAEQHPEVYQMLRDRYEAWWAKVEPKLQDFHPISIGAKQENPVTLSAADWANVYCDNMNDLRKGKPENGPWHVLVENDGKYEFSLRRWPKEADAAIAGPVPEFKAREGELPAGVALPIAKARLKIGAFDETKPVPTGAKAVTFTVDLKTGPKTEMQTWFYDADGKELCGAYFTDVERK